MIYFIGHYWEEVLLAVKIGHSAKVDARLGSLQTSTPGDLRVLAEAPGGVAEEKELHARFRASSLRGEWFRPTEELMALIQAHATSPMARPLRKLRPTRITVDLTDEDYARLVDLAHSMGEAKAEVVRRAIWLYEQLRDLREEISAAEGLSVREVALAYVAQGHAHVLDLAVNELGHPEVDVQREGWLVNQEAYTEAIESGEFLAWESEALEHQVNEIREVTGLQNRGSVIRFAVRHLRALLAQQQEGDHLAWVKARKARRAWLPKPADVRVAAYPEEGTGKSELVLVGDMKETGMRIRGGIRTKKVPL